MLGPYSPILFAWSQLQIQLVLRWLAQCLPLQNKEKVKPTNLVFNPLLSRVTKSTFLA